MGVFIPIPVPHVPIAEIAREIESSAVAVLGVDDGTKSGGLYGVVTREQEKVQQNGEHRDYSGKADLPAIAVRCRNAGRTDGPAAGSVLLLYMLSLKVVTEDASTIVARQKCDDVQAGAVAAIVEAIDRQPTSFIPTYQVTTMIEENTAETEEPVMREDMIGRFEATATIEVQVIWCRRGDLS